MPRSRATETRGPTSLKMERYPKQADGRSLRVTQSHLSIPKKLGTRINDLESQLGLAQEELKSLKDHLVDKKSKKQQNISELIEIDVSDEPIDKKELPCEVDELEPKSIPLSTESTAMSDELASKIDEVNSLKIDLVEKEKELEALRRDNVSLKSQLDEKSTKISAAQSMIGELTLKLNEASKELLKSTASGTQLKEKIVAAEKAKEALEKEAKRLRIQTEQWRKAADAASSILVSERCESMDKIPGNMFDHGWIDDSDDVFGGEKRKGIRMFGDLWKKKGHK